MVASAARHASLGAMAIVLPNASRCRSGRDNGSPAGEKQQCPRGSVMFTRLADARNPLSMQHLILRGPCACGGHKQRGGCVAELTHPGREPNVLGNFFLRRRVRRQCTKCVLPPACGLDRNLESPDIRGGYLGVAAHSRLSDPAPPPMRPLCQEITLGPASPVFWPTSEPSAISRPQRSGSMGTPPAEIALGPTTLILPGGRANQPPVLSHGASPGHPPFHHPLVGGDVTLPAPASAYASACR